MLNKIKALWEVIQLGKSVADPEKWKKHQIQVNVLGGLFIGVAQLAKAFNYDIYLDEETATTLAAGVIAAFNWYLTLATSAKVGVGSKSTSTEPLPEIEPISSKEPIREVPAPIEDHSFTK